jgi:hypothetical protein
MNGVFMTKISDTQQRILVAASTQPQTDVREHMQDLKSPAIRDKVIESMLKNGLIIEAPDSEEVVYIISAEGLAAIGKEQTAEPENNEEEQQPEPVAEKPTEQPEEKIKGSSKKQIMIEMLSRDEGASIKQMMDATSWLKHSVHGAMANLKKEFFAKHGKTITGNKNDGEDRIYKIA